MEEFINIQVIILQKQCLIVLIFQNKYLSKVDVAKSNLTIIN
jgi:hypothetical protein